MGRVVCVCVYYRVDSWKKQVPLTLAFDAALSEESLNEPARDVWTRDEDYEWNVESEDSMGDSIIRWMNFEPAQTILIQTYTAWRDDFQDVALTPPNLCPATERWSKKGSREAHTSNRLH